jgi:hypothetical protein
LCQPPPSLGVARAGLELCSTDKWGALTKWTKSYSFSSDFYTQVHLFLFFLLKLDIVISCNHMLNSKWKWSDWDWII